MPASPRITIEMLGSLRVRREGGEAVELPSHQAGAVLAYLALHLESVHPRERLTDLFWPEDDPDASRQKLRHCLHALRRLLNAPPLGCSEILTATRQSAGLNPSMVDTDVARFETCMSTASRLPDPAERIPLLSEAITLYRGELLPGFYHECLEPDRSRLSGLYERALHSLTDAHEAAADLEAAAEYARKAVARDPLMEEAHCRLMRLYAELGRPSAVLRQYEVLREALKEELGEEPAESTRLLVESLRERAQARAAGNGAPPLSPPTDGSASRMGRRSPDAGGVGDPLQAAPAVSQEQLEASAGEGRLPVFWFIGRARRRAAMASVFCVLVVGVTTGRLQVGGRSSGLDRGHMRPAVSGNAGQGSWSADTVAEASAGRPAVRAANTPAVARTGPTEAASPDSDALPMMGAVSLAAGTSSASAHARRLGGRASALARGALHAAASGRRPPPSAALRKGAEAAGRIVPERQPVWMARYAPAPDEKDSEPKAVTVDRAGNIFITGLVQTLHNDVDFLTLKYGPDGRLLWRARYNGPGNDVDRAYSIAVDDEGSVYVTGDSDNGKGNGLTRLAGTDFATVKYDRNGNQLWVARYNGPDDGEECPVRVRVGPDHSVYVTGRSMAARNIDGGRNAYDEWATVKYDFEGRQRWVRRERAEGDMSAAPADMALDPQGNAYVTGWMWNDRAYPRRIDILTVKYGWNGDVIWRRTWTGPANGNSRPVALCVDSAGDFYVVGETWAGDPLDQGRMRDVFVIKYRPDGNEIWCRTFDHNHWDEQVQTAAAGPSGELGIAGWTVGEGGRDYLTLVYDQNGTPRWFRTYNGPGNSEDMALAAAFDSAGSLIATGQSYGGQRAAGGSEMDYFTVKFRANGLPVWKARYDNRAHWDAGRCVAVDVRDYVIVTGLSGGDRANTITTLKYAP